MGAPLLLPADLRLVLGAGAPGVQEMGCLPVEAQRLAPEPGWGEGRAVGGMCVGIPWAQREGCRVQGVRRWGHPLRGPGWECKGPVRSPPTPPKKGPSGWTRLWPRHRGPGFDGHSDPRLGCVLGWTQGAKPQGRHWAPNSVPPGVGPSPCALQPQVRPEGLVQARSCGVYPALSSLSAGWGWGAALPTERPPHADGALACPGQARRPP